MDSSISKEIKPIFLIGMPLSGKSTIGLHLSETLQLPFHDLDRIIETNLNRSISDIFQEDGEAFFRVCESKALRELAVHSYSVISLGGGAPIFHENMDYILEKGIVIYIRVDIKTLVDRFLQAKQDRPLLQSFTIEETLHYLLDKRGEIYSKAHITINNMSDIKHSISTISHELKNLRSI